MLLTFSVAVPESTTGGGVWPLLAAMVVASAVRVHVPSVRSDGPVANVDWNWLSAVNPFAVVSVIATFAVAAELAKICRSFALVCAASRGRATDGDACDV